jgi:hypothetical protein
VLIKRSGRRGNGTGKILRGNIFPTAVFDDPETAKYVAYFQEEDRISADTGANLF